MRRESEKPPIFKILFERRYDSETATVSDPVVTNDEIQEVITTLRGESGTGLSAGNPANFLKDFLRSNRRNQYWPAEIAEARYTARQAYGEGRVFEFVPYLEGQTVPFPDEFAFPASAGIHKIESVSMPSAARLLGRRDEAWLIQVCVHQRILQTHFSLFSSVKVVDLFHLQNNMKGTPEIDAVFLITFTVDGVSKKALLTLEAKLRDPILPNQIRGQVVAMARRAKRQRLSDVEFILPTAVATIIRDGRTIITMYEMEMVSVADAIAAHESQTTNELPLQIFRAQGYELVPPVVGI